jgi:hypothetical protein
MLEIVFGTALMTLGLLMLALRGCQHRRHRRFHVLALLLTVVALVEARSGHESWPRGASD